MPGREQESAAGRRAVVYCIVPHDLAPWLHEALRRHFRDVPGVEVVVERRDVDRRGMSDRRTVRSAASESERRRIRSATGRRVDERRAALVAVSAPAALPRRARAYAAQLVFVERLEPSVQRLEDADSARVVHRLQAGDAHAFSLLYMRYFERVYAYLRLALGNKHDAEDATQEVFTKVLSAIGRYELRQGKPFRAWLFRVVRNEALTRLKAQGRIELMEPAQISQEREVDSRHSVEVLGWLTDRELVMFLERLAPVQRQVLFLRFALGLSSEETGAVLGRSATDVRMIQLRALDYLRVRMSAIGRAQEVRAPRARMRARVRPAPVLRLRRFALHL